MAAGSFPIFPSPLALYDPKKVDPASLLQDWSVLGQFIYRNIPTLGTDPLAGGAFGDGVHDDTIALQQTINNSGGVLYLKPGKTFLLSSTLAPTGATFIYIYGGGAISSSANPVISLPNQNWLIDNIQINATANVTLLSVVNNTAIRGGLRNCFLSNGGGTGVVLNNSGAGTVISSCVFINLGTGIALTSQTDVLISNCEFTSVTTPVSTSGTCTYRLQNCGGTLDAYPSAETSATATAGGGQAVPATVLTYITMNAVIGGVLTQVKIPAFAV